MSLRTCVHLLVLAFSAAGSAASAQSISLLDISFQEHTQNFTLGESIRLVPLQRPPDTVHVRVFFDSIRHLKNYPADHDNCVHYSTWVLRGIGKPSLITLEALNDQRVLGRQTDGRFGGAVITLVFEAGKQAEHSEIWLNKSNGQLDTYFGHAVEIGIDPNQAQLSVTAESVAHFIDSTRVHLVVTQPNCFHVNPHLVNPDSIAQKPASAPSAPSSAELSQVVATVDPAPCRLPSQASPDPQLPPKPQPGD